MAASPVPLADADGVIHNIAADGMCIVYGVVLQETGGASAVAVVLHEGGSGGVVVGAASVAASGVQAVTFNEGVLCRGDVYMDKVGTGTVAGSVLIK